VSYSTVEDSIEVQDERGLSRAVGSEEGDPLSAPDGEVHTTQRDVPVRVGEVDPLHMQ
jgi:hypothetical protein